MSEATIEYKNGPNESTAYAVSEGKKTKVQMVATPAGDLELAKNPNVDTGYIVIDGKKHKCALVAEVAGELKLPTNATDDTGYVIAQNGRQHKVKLVANITGGGGGTTINNQNITVTENGTYTADVGYTGLGTVEVQVPNPSTGILSIVENGSYDVTEYATAEVNVPTGGGGATTKYGVSIDNLLGNVDENGVYQLSDAPFTFDATSIKKLPDMSGDLFTYKFYKLPLIGTVDLSNYMHGTVNASPAQFFTQAFSYTRVQKLITPRERYGSFAMQFYQSFQHCDALKEIVFSNPIISSSTFGFTETFQYCDFSNASINFDIITSIGKHGFYGAFKYCKLPEEIRFTNLTEITDKFAFREAFSQTTGCKRYFFPSLTSVASDAFGSSTRLTWYNATDVEEIHFRADMQATIEAVTEYSSKFGATNCTIYFDLIGTITVNGVAYSRNEPNSIRVDGNKTFVAWKDAGNNIVYTNATSEPAVDTPVYSDAGTTQVGTVSGVA